MDPRVLYAFRIILTIFAILIAFVCGKLHASWIGLHPPELDMLREDIFHLPKDEDPPPPNPPEVKEEEEGEPFIEVRWPFIFHKSDVQI